MARQLWETVVELGEALTPLGATADLLQITGMTLDLPIEVRLYTGNGGADLRADLPRWRIASGFDPARGRLRVVFGEEAHNGEP